MEQMTGEKLREIREDLDLTPKEMAKKMNVQYQQYWAWENGTKGISRAVARLATFLGDFIQVGLVADDRTLATVNRFLVGDGPSMDDSRNSWVAIIKVNGKKFRAGHGREFQRRHIAESWVTEQLGDYLEASRAWSWKKNPPLIRTEAASS